MKGASTDKFRSCVRAHYESRGRHSLPWRRTRDPYRVFVSEVMLQQTQISRVIPKYKLWIRVFPNWRALAQAPFGRVLKMWHGLGYNRRARFLQESAKIILREYGGSAPTNVSRLEALPGIGPYTARAITCFANGVCEPFIETNIRRAIIGSFFSESKLSVKDSEILRILKRIEPRTGKRDWYLALMDYGADAFQDKKNPNIRSHRYSRQSRFEGSPRYARARIVRLVLEGNGRSEAAIRRDLAKDPHAKAYKRADILKKLLQALEKEQILVYNNRRWAIAP